MNATGINASERPNQGLGHDRQEIPAILAVLLALTITLIVVLNPLCLLVLHRARGIQETTKMFLASLTISDICNGIFTAVPELISLLLKRWPFGEFSCRMLGGVYITVPTINFLSLLLLTIDRFIAIVHALHYPRLMTPKRSKVLIAITWALPTLYLIPYGLIGGQLQVTVRSFCILFQCDVCYYLHVCLCMVTLGIILALYLWILKVARNQARLIANQDRVANPPEGQRAPQPISTKSATTVILITGTLFLCWTPIPVAMLVMPLHVTARRGSVFILTVIAFCTNNWMNGLIYYWRNRELRQALHGLFHCCC